MRELVNRRIESTWFGDFVSRVREAIGDALSLIENQPCRLQTNAVVQAVGLHKEPHTLSERAIVTELGKAMTRDRLEGRDLEVYEGIYPYLPPLKRIRDALFSPEFHQNVRIPPTPPVIVDGRIPAEEFWIQINKQVFVILVDE